MPGCVCSRRERSAPSVARPRALSRLGTRRIARTRAAARRPSTPARVNSKLGMWAHCSAVGGTTMPWAGPSGVAAGPGAGVAYLASSERRPPKASGPVTFCSITAGARASVRLSVAPIRHCGWSWWARRRRSQSAASAAKPLGSSCSPSSRGTWSSAQSAPSPQARVTTSAWWSNNSNSAGPSGVRVARHQCCAPTRRCVGSAGPLARRPSAMSRRPAAPSTVRCAGDPAAPERAPASRASLGAGRGRGTTPVGQSRGGEKSRRPA